MLVPALEAGCIAVGAVLVFGTSPVSAASQHLASNSDGGDWVYVDHDLAGTRYSHLKQITTKNVSGLVKAFQHRAGGWRAGRRHLGPDPAARKHGGGNLWTPMSFDVQRNLLYVPGGNAAPDLYDNDRHTTPSRTC